jgi:signal transduction histidine kinase
MSTNTGRPQLGTLDAAPAPTTADREMLELQAQTLAGVFRWCLVALTPLFMVFLGVYLLNRDTAALVLATTFGAFQLLILYARSVLAHAGPMRAQHIFLVTASAVVLIYLLLAPDPLMLVGMMGIFFFIRLTTAFEPTRTVPAGLGWMAMFVVAVLARWAFGIVPIRLESSELFVVIGLPVAVMFLFAQADFYVGRGLSEAFRRNQRQRDALLGANDALTFQRSQLATLAQRQEWANAELGRANTELRTIAFAISHDLRAPLVNVRGFTSELRRDLDELQRISRDDDRPPRQGRERLREAINETMPASLAFIETSVERMDALISSILMLSHIGHRELCVEDVDVAMVVQHTLASNRHTIQQKAVAVDIEALPVVKTDALAMTQILSNLLVNAINYLEPTRPGRIRIWSDADEDGRIHLAVTDNGRGVSPGQLRTIFHPFTRVGPRTAPGEGMGLAYVETLVHRLGGSVWCESELGVGSTFHFTVTEGPGTAAYDRLEER